MLLASRCRVVILQRSNARVIAIPLCKTSSKKMIPLCGRCLMQSMAVNMIAFYLISVHLRLWNFHAGNYVRRLTTLLIILPLFMWKILLSASYYCRYPWLGLNHSRYNSDLSSFQLLRTILSGNEWVQVKAVSIILIYQEIRELPNF